MKKNGFTLVETLVSISILAVISTVVLIIVFIVLRSSAKTQLQQEIKQNGEEAVVIMTDFIRRAKTVTCKSNSIDVTIADPEVRVTTFFCSDSELKIASASAGKTTVYLTGDTVVCDSDAISFNCNPSSSPNYVDFSFSLSSAEEGEEAREFTGKVLLLNRQ